MATPLPPLAPEQLSVVVQGPVIAGTTARVLESIRRHLPGAEIILSTWAGAQTTGLDCDILVENRDPGPIETKALKGANLNRLLWSTRQGLARATRPYGLKFRTDLLLHGPQLLSYFPRFPVYQEPCKIFQERIVISNTVTWRTSRQRHGCYHPSDMFGLGRIEDLRRWWNVPLFPFAQHDEFDPEPPLIFHEPGQLPIEEIVPEQYIWLSSLRRSRNVLLPRDPQPADLRQDLSLLLNNFIIVEPRRAGIQWLRPVETPFGYEARFFDHAEFCHLYRQEVEGRPSSPPFSIFLKKLQLKLIELNPGFLKPLWRAFKKAFLGAPAGKTG